MADGALAPGMLATTVELYRLFALDESEKVHVAVADVLASGFGAEAAVFLFRDGRREFRLCLNGKDSPIHALKAHWEEIAVRSPKVQGVSKFGPWGIPGMINPLDHWMSVQLNSKKRNIGYLLIGRFKVPWENDDTLALESIAHSIEPIIDARIEREREAFIRSHVDFIPSKSERRFQAFFEDTRDMVYTANSEDIMTTVNQAGLTLTGRTEKHELLGHPFSSLALNSADREFFLHRIFLEGNVADYEIVLVKKDGNTAFCLETAHALRGQSGEIVEVQGIIKDISERIRHEGELWKTNLELAEANLKLKQAQVSMVSREKMASIGQLSAGIAHEINNPVGFLKQYADAREIHL